MRIYSCMYFKYISHTDFKESSQYSKLLKSSYLLCVDVFRSKLVNQ